MVRYATGPQLVSAFSEASKWLEALVADPSEVPPQEKPVVADSPVVAEPKVKANAANSTPTINENPLEALEKWKKAVEASELLSPAESVATPQKASPECTPECTPENDLRSVKVSSQVVFAVEKSPDIMPCHEVHRGEDADSDSELDILSDSGHIAFQALSECAAGFPLLCADEEERIVCDLDETEAQLLRSAFNCWTGQRRRTQEHKAASVVEARQRSVQQQALSFWLCDQTIDLPMLKAILHGWCEVNLVERIRRSDKRSLQRIGYSPDHRKLNLSPVLASPAPMQRALGAFLSNSRVSFTSVCFLAWRECVQKTKRGTAAAMWVMERMAMSQGGLAVQAIFSTWCRLAAQNRLPAWAAELQQNVRFLAQAHGTGTSPLTRRDSSSCSRIAEDDSSHGSNDAKRKIWMIPVLICLASLFVHVLLVAIQHGLTAKDSDGDGVADAEDRCPASLASLNFRSSWRTDWDGDGCLDTAEDEDDDDDNIPDSRDLCPRTVLSQGFAVDKDGCTAGQLLLQKRGSLEDEGSSMFQNFGAKFWEVFAEVLMGMLLTAGLTYGSEPIKDFIKKWRDRLGNFLTPGNASPSTA